jgi:hypothetical protein
MELEMEQGTQNSNEFPPYPGQIQGILRPEVTGIVEWKVFSAFIIFIISSVDRCRSLNEHNSSRIFNMGVAAASVQTMIASCLLSHPGLTVVMAIFILVSY